MINIEVNNRFIKVSKGETILSALREHGIRVPTLCSMSELSPTGACRMCVVEVEGFENLVPACSYRVQEGMHIRTHSERVLKARKVNVELLLSSHPDDCLYCERNGNCELQKLAEDLNVRSRNIQGQRNQFKIDTSSHGIVRDPGKCILCGRCVRICEEIVGVSCIDFERRGDRLQIATAMAEPLQFSSCIECGMCVVSCPTGALIDHPQYQELASSLDDPDRVVSVQYSPEVAVSLAEEFGFKPGTDLRGVMNNALRRIGFDHVFETAFGADMYVMEQAAEFVKRYRKQENLPLISSRCTGWINYVETFRPDLLSNLTPVRSPQQLTGKLIKTWFAESARIAPNRIHNVLITNCTADKGEARRQEYVTGHTQDIDYVLTTRELARLIRLNGTDLQRLEPEPADGPFHAVSSAGKLFAIAGGEAEATLRTVSRELTKKEMSDSKLTRLRGSRAVRETTLSTPKGEISFAAVSGLKQAIRLLDEIAAGKKKYDFIEVMVCPDGCVNGGGQPIPPSDEITRARTRTINEIDKNEALKAAHKNTAVKRVYEEFAGGPGTDASMGLFLARFSQRKVLK